jgi:hypothetical protein
MGEDNKETIKYMLEHYNDIEADIRDKKYAIINVENMTKDASTSNYSGVGSQRDFYVESSNLLFIANRDEKLRKLQNEIKVLELKRDMLDGYINILKPVAKQIIELCYKSQWTEEKTAEYMKMQSMGVHKSKIASIEKMQKIYEKNRKEED